MSAIWLGVAALAVLAVACVFLRVIVARSRDLGAAPSDQPDARAAFAQRRRELEAEALAQGLDRDALAEEMALDALDHAPADALGRNRSSSRDAPPRLPLLAGGLAVAALSVGLYALWGEPHAQTLADAERLMTLASEGDDAALARLLDALESRARRKPSDRDSWFLLGHARMRSGDFADAASAFAALHDLAGANPQVDLAWAQARYLADGGMISAATQAIVDRVLASNPNHPELLELLAMASLRQGDFTSGARRLVQALGQPLPAPRRRLLTETLALARARLDPRRPLVEVVVEASWDAPHPPWLMVFARPPSGGMPVAALRTLAAASQTVILDDATTMLDGKALAESGPLRVVARLSESGEAAAADAEVASLELADPVAQPRIQLRVGGERVRPNQTVHSADGIEAPSADVKSEP